MQSPSRKEDSLHRLIKSLHKGEKRFFAAYCNHYGNAQEKIYLQLFMAIDKQKQYNDAALKEKFAGKSYSEHLHVIKNYLQNLILDSLQVYRNRNAKNLRKKFARAETYFEKGLYEQAEQILNRLWKQAESEEDHIILFEILRLEKRLMLARSKVDENKVEILKKVEEKCFESYHEICDYMYLGLEVGHLHFKYHESNLTIEDITQRKIDQKPLFTNIKAPRTTYGGYLLHNARGTYYRTISEFEKASKECALALQVIDADPAFRERHVEMTFAALLNYVTSILILKDYKKALETMLSLRNFITRNMSEFRESILIKYFNMEQRVSMLVGKKEDAVWLLKNLEQYISSHSSIGDSDKVVFYFNAVDMYLFYGDYSKSLQWLNRALGFKGIERGNTTLYRYLRIIQVILLFEMREYELMEYRIRSLYRYLVKQHTLMKFEKVLISFFRSIFKKPVINNESIPNIMGELHVALQEVFKDKSEAGALQYFDILSWVESKTKKRPLSDIIREKAGI